MTKEQLIDTLSRKTGIENNMVRIIIEAFATEVSTQMLNGNTVHMRGFGAFTVRHCKMKIGRLISKRKKIIIPPHDQPYFKPSQRLKDLLKERTTQTFETPEE
jgi:DNA-binding protein HU-beta